MGILVSVLFVLLASPALAVDESVPTKAAALAEDAAQEAFEDAVDEAEIRDLKIEQNQVPDDVREICPYLDQLTALLKEPDAACVKTHRAYKSMMATHGKLAGYCRSFAEVAERPQLGHGESMRAWKAESSALLWGANADFGDPRPELACSTELLRMMYYRTRLTRALGSVGSIADAELQKFLEQGGR